MGSGPSCSLRTDTCLIAQIPFQGRACEACYCETSCRTQGTTGMGREKRRHWSLKQKKSVNANKKESVRHSIVVLDIKHSLSVTTNLLILFCSQDADRYGHPEKDSRYRRRNARGKDDRCTHPQASQQHRNNFENVPTGPHADQMVFIRYISELCTDTCP